MLGEVNYHGWDSVRLSSGAAEVVIPLDIGPRIVACCLGGGANLFRSVPEEWGGKGETEWKIRGGHRLWHSPEDPVRTYGPDNERIKLSQNDAGKSLTMEAPRSDHAGMLKKIKVESFGNECFKLTHTLTNNNLWPVRSGPWALTVMEYGGYATVPLLPKGNHANDLLPNYQMIPWSYTDFSQPCWQFRKDFIGIDSSQTKVPQKLGLTSYPGWAAYWQSAGTFVKSAKVESGAEYPDFGSSFEIFSCDSMTELETLAPLTELQPGASAAHVEFWRLFAGLPKPTSNEIYENDFKPVIDKWVRTISNKV